MYELIRLFIAKKIGEILSPHSIAFFIIMRYIYDFQVPLIKGDHFVPRNHDNCYISVN